MRLPQIRSNSKPPKLGEEKGKSYPNEFCNCERIPKPNSTVTAPNSNKLADSFHQTEKDCGRKPKLGRILEGFGGCRERWKKVDSEADGLFIVLKLRVMTHKYLIYDITLLNYFIILILLRIIIICYSLDPTKKQNFFFSARKLRLE